MTFSSYPSPSQSRFVGGAWVHPTWARYVYDVFYRENGIRCACAKQCVPGPLPALWEGPGYEAKMNYTVLSCDHEQTRLKALAEKYSARYHVSVQQLKGKAESWSVFSALG